MSKPQRNSPERVDMLANRYAEQRRRTPGITRWFGTRTGNGESLSKNERPSYMRGVPPSINRRTGKPHEHNRQKARRLAA